MATLPYWNNDEVISSDKLNSMVKAIIDGDPLAIKVSNATKNDVSQIVSYLSSLYNSAKTNLNSATSTSAFDTAYTDMKSLVSNKLGSYANDDTVDLYSTGIRASIITFLQAYDTMMSNDRLNNKNTDNTLNGRIDSEAQTRANNDNAINTKISDMQANGGGRNLIANTGTDIVVDDTSNTGTYGYLFFPLDLTEQLKKGDAITVSAEGTVTGTGDISTYSVLLYDFTKNMEISNKPQLKSGQRDSAQIIVNQWIDGNINQLIIYAGKQGDTQGKKSIIHHLMVERGTVAHDWSPAPEDTDSNIKSVNAKADANTASISKITSNGGGRNLLTGTSGDWITKTASGWMNITTAKSNKTSVADYSTGDEFTYSVTVNNASDSDVLLEMYRCDKDGNRITGVPGYLANSDHVAPNTYHKRISCTISIDENTWFVEHTLIAAGGTSTSKTVRLKGEMLEAGTVAHDWSPNPDEVQSQLDNLNASKLSSADANWTLVSKNSSNTYNYDSGSKITLPNNSSITINSDHIDSRIYIPTYFRRDIGDSDLNNFATIGEYDNVFVSSDLMATFTNRPTNPDTNEALTGDCFFTGHYAYSGTTVRAFQKIYSCDYNYVFIRSYNSSSQSWTNWSCLTPYA